MLSYGLLSSIKNSSISLKQSSKLLLSSLTKRYHNNVIQTVASHKIPLPFMKYYSKATFGILASSLVLACSITQSDELPNNTDTSKAIESTLPPTSTATTITTTTTNIDPLHDTAMFPPIQPYHKGMLQVSDIHSIAYSVYGNPVGKPVLGINNFIFIS